MLKNDNKVKVQTRTQYIRSLTIQLKHVRVNSDKYLMLNNAINKFWVSEITNKI